MWAGKGTRQANGILYDAWLAYNQKSEEAGAKLAPLEALKFIIGFIGTAALSSATYSDV